MSINSETRRSGYHMPGVLAGATREMNDLFDRLFEQPVTGATPRNRFAAISVWEDDQSFHFEMDLPDVAADDIDVTVDDGRLLVTAKRHQPDDRTYLHNERHFGEVQRTIALPDAVDSDSIEAGCSNGVLSVTLAKLPEVQPRKIQVKSL